MYREERGKYGSPRIMHRLRRLNQRHSRKRVARLMREGGLYARKRRVFRATTKANSAHRASPNLLDRQFPAVRPNTKWVADITELKTVEGKLCLAVTLDLYSRRVVGWAMDKHMEASLVQRALRMAIEQRQPAPGFLHHSDRGSQTTDSGFRRNLAAKVVRQSMSRKGNVWDNSPMESFFATLEKELIDDTPLATRSQLITRVFDWIEAIYNRRRMHSTLAYLSPVEFEAQHWLGVA